MILLYIIIFLYPKYHRHEKKLDYLDKISRVIEVSDEKMKDVDSRGSFSSDDEVGFFFQQIKGLQDILNEFKLEKK